MDRGSAPVAPPGPASSRLAQTIAFTKNPVDFLEACHREHGDLFRVRLLGLGDWVFVCSPELLRELLKNEDSFSAGAANRRFLGRMMGPDATFSLSGTSHQGRRRLLMPFLSGKSLLGHLPMMREQTHRMIDSWPVDEPFPLLDEINRLTLRIILRAVFGDLDGGTEGELLEAAHTYFEEGLRSPLIFFPALQWNLGRHSPWGRVLAQRERLFSGIEREVDAVLAGRRTGGVLEQMATAALHDGGRLDRQALIDESANLLFGAQESTAKVLTSTLLMTHLHPEVLAKARAEVETVVADDPVDAEHAARLDYLDAVIREGMRRPAASPVAGVRTAVETAELGGYTIPQGTTVAQGYAVMTQRADLFARPDDFDPDRHFHQRRMKPYTFHPFGGGTRMCLGKAFAQLELKVLVATILQRVELVTRDRRLETVRSGFLVAPKDGGVVRLVTRRPRTPEQAPERAPEAPVSTFPQSDDSMLAEAAAAGCPFAAAARRSA